MNPSRIELGCGSHKRAGFFGIDKFAGPQVDLVLDIEKERLPFADDSVDYVYSSHTFEHLDQPGSPIQTLKEIVRVARDRAMVEIWTPHGNSNDGLLFGHRNFYTETHWGHICHLYPEFFLGESPARFAWEKTQYVLSYGLLDELEPLGVSIDFALKHFNNAALEFGVFLRVYKERRTEAGGVRPELVWGYARDQILPKVATGTPPDATRPVVQPSEPPRKPSGGDPDREARESGYPTVSAATPLRHRVVDVLNDSLKTVAPWSHTALKSLVRKMVR